MKKILKYSFLIAVLFTSILVLEGCDDATVDPPPPGGGSTSTTIAGIVLDENKQPVAGATVTAHGSTMQTGAGGEFVFSNITVPDGRLFVNVTKAGYYNATKGEIPRSGDITNLKIVMMQKTVTHTVNSTTGGSADLTNGSKVEIQPNSVVTQGGSQYNGNINMSVVYMDPTSTSFTETVQGGDMAALRSDSSSATLLSFGILKVILEGTGGEQLQIAAGSSSTITSTIPASMVSSAPNTIPLWFFDEQTGLWREEGSATKQGDKYIGTVNHFTDWNCDHPGETGTVTGLVYDCNNQPAPGLTVKVGQMTATTDATGRYTRNVPAGISFDVSIEAAQNFGITAGPINVSPVPAGSNTTLTTLSVPCNPIIKGVFTDCNGNQVNGTVSARWDNQIQAVSPNGVNGFNMMVAPNKPITLRFVAIGGQIKDTTFQTPSTAVTVDMGTIRMCTGVTNCENSFTINGAGFNNVFYNLNPTVAIGIFFPADNETGTSAVGSNQDFVALFFPGNTTGMFTNQDGNLKIQGIIFQATESVTVTVTEYEGVGGIIKGTFSGTFQNINQQSAQVDGKFCVTRQPDQN